MPKLIDTTTAAKLCGLSVSTLNRWRVQGVGPEFLKLVGAIRYRIDDVEEWLEANRQTRTREHRDVA